MPAEGDQRMLLRIQALWRVLGEVLRVVEDLAGPRPDVVALLETVRCALEDLEGP